MIKPMLAKPYKDQDPTGWWMSEKLDGVRAIWNGKEFVSRNGNAFNAPPWFTTQFPFMYLDGELFAGRKKFQQCVGTVKKKTPVDAEWEQVTYQVFDAPLLPDIYERRMQVCRAAAQNSPMIEVVPYIKCEDKDHLIKFFTELVSKGAEGVMLRQPGSPYEQKRSRHLLKYKPVETDEAVVVGHIPGEGKHAGRLGALVCDWNGIKFGIGTGMSDQVRENPPFAGVVVTFSYQELTKDGVPRFPVFVGIRDYE